MASNKEQIVAVFRAEPGHGTVPLVIRVRRFLKAALRQYGLRCVRFEELPDLREVKAKDEE